MAMEHRIKIEVTVRTRGDNCDSEAQVKIARVGAEMQSMAHQQLCGLRGLELIMLESEISHEPEKPE